MKTKSNRIQKTQKLVVIAFLIALIVVLQLIANFFKVGAVSISLVLIPITVGSIMFGISSGAVLGAVFGAVCFIYGLVGLDPTTFEMITFNPIFTALICFGKGIAAGIIPSLVYQLIMKITNRKIILSSIIASFFTPIVNTGLFLLGAVTVFKDFFRGDTPVSALALLLTLMGLILVNFIFELISCVIISPTVTILLSKNKSFKQLYK